MSARIVSTTNSGEQVTVEVRADACGQTHFFYVRIDAEQIVARLGEKVVMSKGKRARYLHGCVIVEDMGT